MNIDTSSNESWTRSICKRLCEDLRLFKQDKKYQTYERISEIHSNTYFLWFENKNNNNDFKKINLTDILNEYPEFTLNELLSYDFCNNYCKKYVDKDSEVFYITDKGQDI